MKKIPDGSMLLISKLKMLMSEGCLFAKIFPQFSKLQLCATHVMAKNQPKAFKKKRKKVNFFRKHGNSIIEMFF